MVSALKHRGPDASGVEQFNGCALGHNRLRIIDLREVADQPIQNEDHSIFCVFNGEIYNFRELRAELKSVGHCFYTETDAEVLVHLYEEHGRNLVQRLRGMFAFAIWDDRKRSLLLARDRLGIKPLYYSNDGGHMRFASEAKALAQGSQKLNRTALAGYLRLGWVPGPETIYEGIFELPPGHIAEWSVGIMSVSRWWEPPQRCEPGALAHSGDLSDVLVDSLQRHLVADVPVGLFLSSGLDSVVLAFLAAKAGAPLETFTVVFDSGVDESAAASAIAARLSLPHKTIHVTASTVLQYLPQIISDMDQPTVNGVNTWIVSRSVRQAGMNVALSGLGGDELFEGYSTFRRVPALHRAGKVIGILPQNFSRKTADFIEKRSGRHAVRRTVEAITNGGWSGAYAAMRGVMGEREHARLLPGWTNGGLAGLWVPEGLDDTHVLTQMELRNYLPQQLLRDTDIMSMAHSLEVRVPLLDDEVVMRVLSTPLDPGGRHGKARLAAAVDADLTPLASSPKMTFSLPFDEWLKGPLADTARSSLARLSDPDVGLDLWELSVLWDEFIDGRTHWRTIWALTALGFWVDAHLTAST